MGSALGLAQADDMPTYRLTARDGRFEPAELLVPEGQKFRLEITNAGRDPVEFESLELRKEKVLAPGVTSSLVFRPLDVQPTLVEPLWSSTGWLGDSSAVAALLRSGAPAQALPVTGRS